MADEPKTEASASDHAAPPVSSPFGRGVFPTCVKLSLGLALLAWVGFLTIALWAPSRGYVYVLNLWAPVVGWPLLFAVNFLFAHLISRFKHAFGALWAGNAEENGEILRLMSGGAVVILAAVAAIYSASVLVHLARKKVAPDAVAGLPGIYRVDPDVH